MSDGRINDGQIGDGRIAVIGGGLGGLAAAVVLAARGHRVVLLEKNPWLGGKAAVLEEGGFRFDMGPTILTVPRVLRRIFAEAGRDLDRAVPLVRLDPQWRCFFEDGAVLDLGEDVGAMADTLDTFAPGRGVGDGYRRFLARSERLHGISERFFFWKPVEDLKDTIDMRRNFSAGTLSDVLALRMGTTVAGTIRGHVPDARVAQMLDHFGSMWGPRPTDPRRCCAPSPTCRPARASGTRWAARARCPTRWNASPATWASRSAPAPASRASSWSGAASARSRPRRGSASP